MSIKHEIESMVEEPKRHTIGNQGHSIVLRETGGDGREKWAILNLDGETQGYMWGRDAAEAACRQLIEEGIFTR